MNMPRKALEDVLVVAFEQAVAAPYCTSRLADAGARVIKVERPEGDFARLYDQAVGDVSSHFAWINRGKESLIADLKDDADRDLLLSILKVADVFVQNLAPGAVQRLGFGSEELRALNPRLITLDISGYGVGNSYSDLKAYDLLVQAESGLASLTGLPEAPGRVGVSVCDIACGMNAHAAILEALLARERTGVGCSIAVSLFDSAADWMNQPLAYAEGTGNMPERVGLAHPTVTPYGAFESADGVPVLISIQNEREWLQFCRHVLGDEAIASADGYSSAVARLANRAAVNALVAEHFARYSTDDLVARLRSAGTAFGRVNDVSGLARHPALRRLSIPVPGGSYSMAAPAAIFDGEAPHLGAVPALGSNNDEIRAEFGAGRHAPSNKEQV
jgi:crotonobetainyl-CoA:carnitine CoA-transferase CaiB-like acyl-CoA transferase